MIRTEDLSKQFGDLWAVDRVDLDVQPGQLLALLGPNGAGKTTTVRLLTSVLKPTRGRAIVAGYDVVGQADKVRSEVGVLSEHHGLYPRMSAGEYLDFFGKVYRLDTETRQRRVHYLLEYFGLEKVKRQVISEYSKGMRQKLALARTLIHEPPVLLLDEPTSAMDPESARLVRDSIAGLRNESRTIVICTHNLAEAEALADKIAIIHHGRILVTGTVNELKTHLLGPPEYEIHIRGKWSGKKLNLPQDVKLSGNGPAGPRFQVKDPENANPLVIQELVRLGLSVVSVQEVPRTLEQVYLEVMVRENSNTGLPS